MKKEKQSSLPFKIIKSNYPILSPWYPHDIPLIFAKYQHGGDDAVNVPCMQQLRCCFRPQSETREDPQAMLLF